MKGGSHGAFQHPASKGKQAALGGGMFGGSGVVAVYGAGCLLACAIIAASGVVAAWPAALLGRRRMHSDIGEIRERAHR